MNVGEFIEQIVVVPDFEMLPAGMPVAPAVDPVPADGQEADHPAPDPAPVDAAFRRERG